MLEGQRVVHLFNIGSHPKVIKQDFFYFEERNKIQSRICWRNCPLSLLRVMNEKCIIQRTGDGKKVFENKNLHKSHDIRLLRLGNLNFKTCQARFGALCQKSSQSLKVYSSSARQKI